MLGGGDSSMLEINLAWFEVSSLNGRLQGSYSRFEVEW